MQAVTTLILTVSQLEKELPLPVGEGWGEGWESAIQASVVGRHQPSPVVGSPPTAPLSEGEAET